MAALVPKTPEFRDIVQRIFDRARFVQDIGIQLGSVSPGEVESFLKVEPKHLQQDGVVHAGVQATMGDHTAGMAAATLLAVDETVLSIEFKVNLLRPAAGERLRCKSTVLRQGRTLATAESEIFATAGNEEKLVSKMTVTLAIVSATHLAAKT